MAEISSTPPLTRRSVADAHALIRPHIHATPVVTSRALSELASTPRSRNNDNNDGDGAARPRLRLWFKCENLQRVGAFKVRGAFHALERLKREPGWAEGGGRERGVVTHSSGRSERKKKKKMMAGAMWCFLCVLVLGFALYHLLFVCGFYNAFAPSLSCFTLLFYPLT